MWLYQGLQWLQQGGGGGRCKKQSKAVSLLRSGSQDRPTHRPAWHLLLGYILVFFKAKNLWNNLLEESSWIYSQKRLQIMLVKNLWYYMWYYSDYQTNWTPKSALLYRQRKKANKSLETFQILPSIKSSSRRVKIGKEWSSWFRTKEHHPLNGKKVEAERNSF